LLRSVVECFEPEIKRARMQVAAEGGKGGKGGKGQSEGGKGGKGRAEGVEEDVPPPPQLPLDVPFPIMMVRTSCIVLSFTHCA
jgi:hypothetical protein